MTWASFFFFCRVSSLRVFEPLPRGVNESKMNQFMQFITRNIYLDPCISLRNNIHELFGQYTSITPYSLLWEELGGKQAITVNTLIRLNCLVSLRVETPLCKDYSSSLSLQRPLCSARFAVFLAQFKSSSPGLKLAWVELQGICISIFSCFLLH